MEKELETLLGELDEIMEEVEQDEEKNNKVSSKSSKSSRSKNNKSRSKTTKTKLSHRGTNKNSHSTSSKHLSEEKELKEVEELKNSIKLLEHEMFIKIDNPLEVVEDLKNSKKSLKEITKTLSAISKINRLKEELLSVLNKQIDDLKETVRKLEDSLNIKENIEAESHINYVSQDYTDNIENDIEEIRKNIGLAK